jgi:hypothetical protein
MWPRAGVRGRDAPARCLEEAEDLKVKLGGFASARYLRRNPREQSLAHELPPASAPSWQRPALAIVGRSGLAHGRIGGGSERRLGCPELDAVWVLKLVRLFLRVHADDVAPLAVRIEDLVADLEAESLCANTPALRPSSVSTPR